MSSLSLTIACRGYDRVSALMDGRVSVEGCTVNFLSMGPEEVFFRAFRHQEFDVCELSLSRYIITLTRQNTDYIAVPIFPSRMFRHSGIYIYNDTGITKPEDLMGRTVGVPEYQMTAAVWIRGMLQDEYGVDPKTIHWRTGGLEEPGRYEKVSLDLPEEIDVEPINERNILSRMLLDGEIDALVTPRIPSCFQLSKPSVSRLFPDYRSVERAYFEKTGLFPIMHTIGIRRRLLDEYPWLASSIYKAFTEAKHLAMSELADTSSLLVTLPWFTAELDDTRALMGDDYWPYGVDKNYLTIETLLRYSHEQGLSPHQLAVEDLFAESTLDSAKG